MKSLKKIIIIIIITFTRLERMCTFAKLNYLAQS